MPGRCVGNGKTNPENFPPYIREQEVKKIPTRGNEKCKGLCRLESLEPAF